MDRSPQPCTEPGHGASRYSPARDEQAPAPGTQRVIDGELRVFYCGYWVKVYAPPADTLSAKKQLIEALTRRLFNHVEHGLNIPGRRLAEAREAYEREADPARKRVKAGMLAGALFNRATDIFTKVVEMQALGVQVEHDNALLCECGEYFREALELGRMVFHRSGEEGIDELWGEPLKVFTMPIECFYESRYIKIAQTMRELDALGQALEGAFVGNPAWEGVPPLIRVLVAAARRKCEILRTDPEVFEVWTDFVTASERLCDYRPTTKPAVSLTQRELLQRGKALLRAGTGLIRDITRARVPMPKSARALVERCERYRRSWVPADPLQRDG